MLSFHPSAAEEQALGLEHFVTQEIRALTAYAGFIALCVNDFPLFQIQCVLLCSALLFVSRGAWPIPLLCLLPAGREWGFSPAG